MAGGKKTTLKEVGETLAFIVERMATKDDLKNQFAEFAERFTIPQGEQLASIERELKSLRVEFTALRDKSDASDYSKEIDHALERIAAIEKHLGLNKKIAA